MRAADNDFVPTFRGATRRDHRCDCRRAGARYGRLIGPVHNPVAIGVRVARIGFAFIHNAVPICVLETVRNAVPVGIGSIRVSLTPIERAVSIQVFQPIRQPVVVPIRDIQTRFGQPRKERTRETPFTRFRQCGTLERRCRGDRRRAPASVRVRGKHRLTRFRRRFDHRNGRSRHANCTAVLP